MLLDPRWQKRRLEIMQNAEFRCEICDDETSTLHVHHVVYKKGAAPWEYSGSELQCLCEDCHEQAEESRYKLLTELATYATFLSLDSFVAAINDISFTKSGLHPVEAMTAWLRTAREPDLLREAYKRCRKQE